MAPDGRSFITAVGVKQSSVWLHDSRGERQISLEVGPFNQSLGAATRRISARLIQFFKSGQLLPRNKLKQAMHITQSTAPTVLWMETRSQEQVAPGVFSANATGQGVAARRLPYESRPTALSPSSAPPIKSDH